MVKVKEDLTGKKFNRLRVICQADDYISPKGQHQARWLCECDCGNKVIVKGANLKNETIKSCGCLNYENIIKRNNNKAKKNKYDLSGEYGIGWTSNTNKKFYFDLEDYEKIKNHCWHESVSKGYSMVMTVDKKTKKYVIMGKLITGYKYCEHKNRNTFDNRKNNLRPSTHKENMQNMSIRKDNVSGFTGVSWNKTSQKWCARITYNYKTYNLGEYNDFEDAVVARLQGEAKYFNKDFATHRDLFEKYGIKIG